MRLIDADALTNRHCAENCGCTRAECGFTYVDDGCDGCTFVKEIENTPTVDAVPVRHAKWEYKCYPTIWYGPGEPPEWVCSECQDRAYDTYDYCPNCGARMDGEEE